MLWGMRLVVPLLLLGVRAFAQGQMPEQVAAKVVAAFEAKDKAALDTHARYAAAWLVADRLCILGKHDAAAAYARAYADADADALRKYVAARRGGPDRRAAHAALERARTAFRARDPARALAEVKDIDTAPVDIVTCRVHITRANASLSLFRVQPAESAGVAAARVAKQIGWLQGQTVPLGTAADAAQRRGDAATAEQHLLACLAIHEQRGDKNAMSGTLINIGNGFMLARDFAKAERYLERGLALAEEVGNRQWQANALSALGVVHRYAGRFDKSMEVQQRCLALNKQLGNPAGLSAVSLNLGNLHSVMGNHEEALVHARRALAYAEQAKESRRAAEARASLGLAYSKLGRAREAIACLDRAVAELRALGARHAESRALLALGEAYGRFGEADKALAAYQDNLALARKIRNRGAAADALSAMSEVQWQRGEHARAIASAERAVRLRKPTGDAAGLAKDMTMLSILYAAVGDPAKALAMQKRVLATEEATGDRIRLAATLVNLGAMTSEGDPEGGRAYLERGLALCRELKLEAWEANALNNLALLRSGQGDHDTALVELGQALELNRKLGTRHGEAQTLLNLAAVHMRRGGAEKKALRHADAALEIATELDAFELQVRGLSQRASVEHEWGQHDAVLKTARTAVDRLAVVVGGLADEQGAAARGAWSAMLEVALSSAVAAGDADAASFFVESNRAGTLLESLGGRGALGDAAIPAELRGEERDARAALTAAQERLDAARQQRRRTAIRSARKALAAANTKLIETAERIQRASKANVAYPRAAPLAGIRAVLGEGDALVSYALVSEAFVALVATRDGARVVRLDAPGAAPQPDGPERPWKEQAAALRKTIVEPLGLDGRVRRVLISPAGRLSYVPFALLMPDREVVYVASGTTLALLADDRERRGAQVLALGDPVYGGKLAPLPATRAEVEALGDVKLLGEQATEAALARALKRSERWSAVHLACHGLVDPERPALSALALTPGQGGDGRLTVLEIFAKKIPSDLVVLSACETARGKIYRAEGVVGFTRAIMAAGAPRVIVSLWKVDDEATRVLMTRFYELWKPGSMATATALKKSQAFVASHDKWEHPYYWAAWQLWGLAD
jgi:tetratricopeptide (TPR) repeat protein